MKYYCVNFTFISSTNEGNPPMDINVTNPKTNAEQAARACRDKVVNALKSFISFMTAHVTTLLYVHISSAQKFVTDFFSLFLPGWMCIWCRRPGILCRCKLSRGDRWGAWASNTQSPVTCWWTSAWSGCKPASGSWPGCHLNPARFLSATNKMVISCPQMRYWLWTRETGTAYQCLLLMTQSTYYSWDIIDSLPCGVVVLGPAVWCNQLPDGLWCGHPIQWVVGPLNLFMNAKS